jgi:hypothetical protein
LAKDEMVHAIRMGQAASKGVLENREVRCVRLEFRVYAVLGRLKAGHQTLQTLDPNMA